MYEKIQDTMRNSIDTNAVALSLLRCANFRDAEGYFDELLSQNPDDAVALLGKLGVKLKHTMLVDYVLGVSDDACVNKISIDLLSKSSDLITRLFKTLTGEALERLANAFDLFLSILLTEGFSKPTSFAALCRFVPSKHPAGAQYIHPYSFMKALPNLGKSLKPGVIDDTAVVMLDRMNDKEGKVALALASARYFKSKKVTMSTYRWYTKLSVSAENDITYLIEGANALSELGMSKESLSFYDEILKREPENIDARLGLLLSELGVHINSKNIDALEACESKVADFVEKLNARTATVLKRLFDCIKPAAPDAWNQKGSFRLLDVVLNRVYGQNKATYAKMCTEVANICLQNGQFDAAKLYVDNAIPNAGDDTHEQYYILLLIAFKCKDEKELLNNNEFTKGDEAYKALLYSVRNNPQLLKKYTELADKILKQQRIHRDALALLLAMDAEKKASEKLHKKTTTSYSIFNILIWLSVIAMPIVYLLVPFALGKSVWFVFIPWFVAAIVNGIFNGKKNKILSETRASSLKTSFEASAARYARKNILPLVLGGIFSCFVFFSFVYCTFYGSEEGFTKDFTYYAIHEDENDDDSEIAGLRLIDLMDSDKEEIFIPAKIKGYDVVKLSPSVLNPPSTIIIEVDEETATVSKSYQDVPYDAKHCLLIHESAKLVLVDQLVKQFGVDYIYYEGTEAEWKKVAVSTDSDVTVYFKGTDWSYNLFGEPALK